MKLQFLLMADLVIVKHVLPHVWPVGRVEKKASCEVSMGSGFGKEVGLESRGQTIKDPDKDQHS